MPTPVRGSGGSPPGAAAEGERAGLTPVNPVVPLALAAAAVLLAVGWALRSARRAADSVLDAEGPDDAPPLPAMPILTIAQPIAPPAAAPTLGPSDRAPLIPIGGAELSDGAQASFKGTGGALVALLGMPEAVGVEAAAARPSGSELPLLPAGSGSPFDGPGLELGTPEALDFASPQALAIEPRPEGRAPAPWRPWRAGVGLLATAAWWFGAPQGDLPPSVHTGLAVSAGAIAWLVAGFLRDAHARGQQAGFEAELLGALEELPAWFAVGVDPETALTELAERGGAGPLQSEARRVLSDWWPAATRTAAFGAARGRRGPEWTRVLFALDEADRTGQDPRRLLAHTAEGLRERIAEGDDPSSNAAGGWPLAIAILVVAIAAAIGMSL